MDLHWFWSGVLQRDDVYLGWPIAPLYMSPNAGGGGGGAGSKPMSTAVHGSPNKLWRSNSVVNLWFWSTGSRSGSRRAKTTHRNRKKEKEKFHVLKCWMFSVEGWRRLLCSLNVITGGTGLSKFQFLVNKFCAFRSLPYLPHKPKYHDWGRQFYPNPYQNLMRAKIYFAWSWEVLSSCYR